MRHATPDDQLWALPPQIATRFEKRACYYEAIVTIAYLME